MVQNLIQWLGKQQERRKEKRNRLTQNIAHRLHLIQMARGRESNEEINLAKAEKIIRNPLTRSVFEFFCYCRSRVDTFESTWVEAALEGMVDDLKNLAIIDLLNIVASLSLISTAIGFFSEADERQKQKHYQAWQVISSAVGQTHEAGRVAAIEDLYIDNIPLDGLDIHKAKINKLSLSPRCFLLAWHIPNQICTFKQQIFSQHKQELSDGESQEATFKLPRIISEQTVFFWKVNFQELELWESNLQKAVFWHSNLKKVQFFDSNFQEAQLRLNDFQEAVFSNSQFQQTNLSKTNFQKANLSANNFQGVDWSDSNLQKAVLVANNLQGANLSGTNLDRALLIDMDWQTVTGLVQEQLEGDNPPLLCNTLVPKEFGIDKDRDCSKLAQALLDHFPKQDNKRGYSSLAEADTYLKTLRELPKLANQVLLKY